MHAEHTAHAGSTVRADGTPRLTAIVPLAPPAERDAKSAPPNSLELPVTGTGQDERSLSVRYELDAVTHRWIASVMDDTTGEVVKTVPSTQVLHQLAALRHPPVDLRA